MKKFSFSTKKNDQFTIFDGNLFYDIYKDSHFLRESDNIVTILTKGHELRSMLKQVKLGESVAVSGMVLADKTPLLVKKTGPNVAVEPFEFTANRLSGLVASYAFDNRSKFPDLTSTEAATLGLMWDNKDEIKSRLFLSAVSGTEQFGKQFHFWPLVCGLRKLQLKKITIEPVMKMSKIKNPEGLPMATQFMRNLATVRTLWSYFPGSSKTDIELQLECLPSDMKKVFYNTKCSFKTSKSRK
ncbi:uncharacterized protein LOC120625119 [Pararge aegeria]|uniref:uncharacterized protein LOC120625119 n=1 Tax=Pararge aegeria TaxID=116150 RepID=UPI0019CFE3DE|nr:uncharacterized protein LOC120625119 [Pararge aegeria]XP_039747992.1 uncharacterized protein LOC120625119 [Pararge aegeria]XP_039747993.1 uncharacterized protein LOC120625119 [Pararge aegeria]XP_039747994.1 uncharacterized protein LOC120625119 [Pararge aegeria]